MSAAFRFIPAPQEEFQFFGLIPAAIWMRRDLSNRAARVLGGMSILARGRGTWCRSTLASIAEACGQSVSTVQRAIKELVRLGVVSWESIGSNFTLLFRLRGDAEVGQSCPAPRIADPVNPDRGTPVNPDRPTRSTLTGVGPRPLKDRTRDEIGGEKTKSDQTDIRVRAKGRDIEEGSVGQSSFSFSPISTEDEIPLQDCRHQEVSVQPLKLPTPEPEVDCYAFADEAPIPVPAPAPVAPPIALFVPEPPPATVAPPAPSPAVETVAALVDRAAAVLGAVSYTQVADAIRKFGLDWVEMAVREVEKPGSPALGWGYVLGILTKWKNAGAVIRIPAPKELPPSRDGPAPQMSTEDWKRRHQLNYSGDSVTGKELPPSLPAAGAMLRDLVRRTRVDAAPSPSRRPREAPRPAPVLAPAIAMDDDPAAKPAAAGAPPGDSGLFDWM